MTTVQPKTAPSPAPLFETLLLDIVSGRYPAGSRLPAERELARQMGASRPTLRETLRRLGEWGLISARRGSGIAVREARDWSLAVLPAYLRVGAPGAGPAALPALIVDLLDLRRYLIGDMLRIVTPRLPAGPLDDAWAAAQRAWHARADLPTFIREDFEVLRAVLVASRFLPALWLLNDLAGVYQELARTLTGAITAPDGYLEAYHDVLTALERKDADVACKAMGRYLEDHDRRLCAALGINR